MSRALLLAGLVACQPSECPRLPADRARDAETIFRVLENVPFELESVDGARYEGAPSSLVLGISERRRRVRAGRPCNPHNLWCTVSGDGVEPTLGEAPFARVCTHTSPQEATADEVLTHPFRVAFDGDTLTLSGARGTLGYRSDYSAPVAGGPLIGTWVIEQGPDSFTRARVRIRMANDRQLRVRYDCAKPGMCFVDGTFGLGCDGQRMRMRIGAAQGPEAIVGRLPLLDDTRSVLSSGDELTLETSDDFFTFRRLDRTGDIEAGRGEF